MKYLLKIYEALLRESGVTKFVEFSAAQEHRVILVITSTRMIDNLNHNDVFCFAQMIFRPVRSLSFIFFVAKKT